MTCKSQLYLVKKLQPNIITQLQAKITTTLPLFLFLFPGSCCPCLLQLLAVRPTAARPLQLPSTISQQTPHPPASPFPASTASTSTVLLVLSCYQQHVVAVLPLPAAYTATHSHHSATQHHATPPATTQPNSPAPNKSHSLLIKKEKVVNLKVKF